MESETAKIKETSSLSQSRKGPKTCYGATRNPQNTPDYRIVAHNLSSSDTLQGLAIKYGVTVEHIRRVNKLWTSDNILIYSTLNIPVKLNEGREGAAGDTWGEERTTGSTNNYKNSKENDHIDVATPSGIGEGFTGDNKDYRCEEVNPVDIDVNISCNEDSNSEGTAVKQKTFAKKNGESLSKYLNKLDSEIKTSVELAKKQRASSGPALINNLEISREKEILKRQKTSESSSPKRLSQAGRTRWTSGTSNDMNALDDLFEL